jgi:hypothetical protein
MSLNLLLSLSKKSIDIIGGSPEWPCDSKSSLQIPEIRISQKITQIFMLKYIFYK